MSIINILAILLLDIIGGGTGRFSKFIPLPTSGTQSVWILVFSVLGAVAGAFIGGYILTPLFLYVHKKIIGRKLIYGFQNRDQSNEFKKYFFKALFPALLTVHLCIIFSSNLNIQELILDNPSSSTIMNQMLTFSTLLPLFSGIGIAIFSPTWFLLDGGIVYSNKKKVEKISDPIEIRSVGGWYIYLMKGYAGISVFITYYDFFSRLLQEMDMSDPSFIMMIVTWPIMPLFIAFIMILALISLDMTFDKRRKFVRNVGNNLGISKPLEQDLDLTKKK
ncbi:MAG: hypothetical protein KGD63_04175 [Candidatus Lokiarchaeota archaeon]|nr:hypothetical protein [Candidatus Lokiarchaeota archaeon]